MKSFAKALVVKKEAELRKGGAVPCRLREERERKEWCWEEEEDLEGERRGNHTITPTTPTTSTPLATPTTLVHPPLFISDPERGVDSWNKVEFEVVEEADVFFSKRGAEFYDVEKDWEEEDKDEEETVEEEELLGVSAGSGGEARVAFVGFW